MKLNCMRDGIAIDIENWQDIAYLEDTVKINEHPSGMIIARPIYDLEGRLLRITILPPQPPDLAEPTTGKVVPIDKYSKVDAVAEPEPVAEAA